MILRSLLITLIFRKKRSSLLNMVSFIGLFLQKRPIIQRSFSVAVLLLQIYTCIYICIYIHIYTYVYIYMYIYMIIHTYVYMHICYECIYIYTDMNIYIHIYSHCCSLSVAVSLLQSHRFSLSAAV